MLYTFSEEAEEILLKTELKINNLKILGRGAQSYVWQGTNSTGKKVAIKLHFEDSSDLVAEKLLNSLKPIELNQPNFAKLFSVDTKLNDKFKSYYKYTIIFQNQKQNDNIFEKLLNEDFKQKGYTALTVLNIFKLSKTVYGSTFENFYDLSAFLKKLNTRGALDFKNQLNEHFKIKDTNFVNALFGLLMNYPTNKFYISEALLADENLEEYIQDLRKRLQRKETVENSIVELKKTAKHILKALIALHEDGIVHRDLHNRNITRSVVIREGKSQKVKYNLIDFGTIEELKKCDNEKDKEILVKDDLRALGYGVLIPAFYQLTSDSNVAPVLRIDEREFSKLSSMKKMDGMDPNFISFLEKLSNDSGYKTARLALSDAFIK